MKNLFVWVQKILPLVYDDSLSYYEVLCKVTDKVNEIIKIFNDIDGEIYNDVAEILTPEFVAGVITQEYFDTWLSENTSFTDLQTQVAQNTHDIGLNADQIIAVQGDMADIQPMVNRLYEHYVPIEQIYGNNTSGLNPATLENYMQAHTGARIVFGNKAYTFSDSLHVYSSIDCGSGYARINPDIIPIGNIDSGDPIEIAHIDSVISNVPNMQAKVSFIDCKLTITTYFTSNSNSYPTLYFERCNLKGYIDCRGTLSIEMYSSHLSGNGGNWLFSIESQIGTLCNSSLRGLTGDNGVMTNLGILIVTGNRIRLADENATFQGGTVPEYNLVYANNIEHILA